MNYFKISILMRLGILDGLNVKSIRALHIIFVSFFLSLLMSTSYAQDYSELNNGINAKDIHNIGFLFRGSSLTYYAVEQSSKRIKALLKDKYKDLKRAGFTDILPAFHNIKLWNLPNYKKAINVEWLVKNKVDTLVVRDAWDYDHVAKLGINLIKIKCCAGSQEVVSHIETMGKIFNPARARFLVNTHNDIIKKIASKTKNIKKRPTILQIRWSKKKGIAARLYNNYDVSGTKLIDGYKYVTGRTDSNIKNPVLDFERLLAADPDIIVIATGSVNPDYFYKHKVLKQLSAAKNKRVYKIPKFAYIDWQPASVLRYLWVAILAHPKEFKHDIQFFHSILRKTYRDIYNTHLSDRVVNDILDLKANHHSKNYSKFFADH